jgi:protein-S-isoprenylcysteine O-methyltransferase Ste14
MMTLRQLLSVVLLPFTMTVLIPWWIYPARDRSNVGTPPSVANLGLKALGILVVVLGLGLFASSLRRFVTDGKGTLAPWDPPRKFVVTGPYRYVRNPMISGVIMILFGEAAMFRETALLLWALTFFAINGIYIPLLEEPGLRARFGEAYDEYCRHVRRLIPRLTPWTGSER